MNHISADTFDFEGRTHTITIPENVRCTGCGNEDPEAFDARLTNYPTEAEITADSIVCNECGNTDELLAATEAHRVHRLSDDEREREENAREAAEAAYVGWQESAAGLHDAATR